MSDDDRDEADEHDSDGKDAGDRGEAHADDRDEEDTDGGDEPVDEDHEDAVPSEPIGDTSSSGFRLEIGLSSLSDLLDGLVGVSSGDVESSSRNTIDWSTLNDRDGRRVRNHGANRTVRIRGSDSPVIDTRMDDCGFLVVADLAGASEDDISVGIDPRTNQLVIAKNSTVVGCVDVPFESPEATSVWFNNGVLEVRLRSR